MSDKHHKPSEDAHFHEHTHQHKCCGGKRCEEKEEQKKQESHKQECCNDSHGKGESSPKSQEAPQAKTMTIGEMELEQLRREVAEYKDKYLRGLAESENGRKRLQKEKHEMIQYAAQNLITEFLSPIDHMENALKFTQQMSEDVKHWAVGFQMILTQFKDILTINGVTPFTSEGKPFDPHRHEAIETVATADFAPGTVIEETVRGYIMGDKVIRPARVKVAKAIEDTK